jgi:hypothetical protein
MMRVIRELNGGTNLVNSKNLPEVTPAMCRWWVEAQKYIQAEQNSNNR